MTTCRSFIATACFCAGIIIGFFQPSPSQAQVQIDVSKITCDQFVHDKITYSRTMAAWLSGYYHGKRTDPLVDPQSFEANYTKLKSFCYQEKNFNVSVMQAIERSIEKK